MARTWIKVDDAMVENPKCVGLSPFAWTLWLHGVSYCSRNLTDGLIPQAILPRLTALSDVQRAADELVDAGMWHVIEGGYEVHDYLDHQRSRADVESDRAGAAERQRKSRQSKGSVTGESHRDDPVTPPAESESVSVSAADSSSSPLTGSTDDEKLSAIVDAVINLRARGEVKSAGWRRTVARNMRTDDGGAWWTRLEGLLLEYPEAPVSMLAAAAEGQAGPHLKNYRKKAS